MSDYVTKDDLNQALAATKHELRDEIKLLRDDFDAFSVKIFHYFDEKFKAVDDRFEAMDQKFSTLQSAADTYRAEQETFRQECLAQGVKLDRVETWAHKVAKKTDTPLAYE